MIHPPEVNFDSEGRFDTKVLRLSIKAISLKSNRNSNTKQENSLVQITNEIHRLGCQDPPSPAPSLCLPSLVGQGVLFTMGQEIPGGGGVSVFLPRIPTTIPGIEPHLTNFSDLAICLQAREKDLCPFNKDGTRKAPPELFRQRCQKGRSLKRNSQHCKKGN